MMMILRNGREKERFLVSLRNFNGDCLCYMIVHIFVNKMQSRNEETKQDLKNNPDNVIPIELTLHLSRILYLDFAKVFMMNSNSLEDVQTACSSTIYCVFFS